MCECLWNFPLICCEDLFNVKPLPIDAYLESILKYLQNSSNLIVEAAPGAGKTTRIPPALLDSSLSRNQQVWVLEPRRLAARLSAQRIANERNEKLGETVGYQVRYENFSNERTRLLFLTEGLFTRKLIHNPTLKGVSIVVLDEFHERNLQTDVALALLRRLQKTSRPDLKIVVMSATMDCASISHYLGDCPIISCEGNSFDVDIKYLAGTSNSSVAELVQTAVNSIVSDGLEGDILVFLPGAAEIRRASIALENTVRSNGILLAKLHGELSPNEQQFALSSSSQRKIILSTNVAETSITIEGLSAVIDSGLERTVEYSAWSGLPTSSIQRISQASARQRAGRAGRTRHGKCIRLYSAMDFSLRAEFRVTEILRSDLSGIILELLATGFNLADLEWLDHPTSSQIENSFALLRSLGAVDSKNQIVEVGNEMTRFPLHPRLSRLLVESLKLGIPKEGAILASMIGERDISKFDISSGRKITSINLFDQLDKYLEVENFDFDPRRVERVGFDVQRVQAVRRSAQQLIQLLKIRPNQESSASEAKMMQILSAGFPDRVAKSLQSDNALNMSVLQKVKMCDGQFIEVRLPAEKADWLLAIEVNDSAHSSAPFVSSYAQLNSEIIFDLFSEHLSEVQEFIWNSKRELVEEVSRLQYRELTLLESKSTAKSSREATRLLAQQLEQIELSRFIGKDKLNSLNARRRFISGDSIHIPLEEDAEKLLGLCEGKVSFREIKEALSSNNFEYLFFSPQEISEFDKNAPEHLILKNSKRTSVNYVDSKTPFLLGYIQDFYGIVASPTLLQGKSPLTLNLLAPNKRIVQITNDLPSFWKNIYPKLRIEMSRNYPKHYWPIEPTTALPILLARNVK